MPHIRRSLPGITFISLVTSTSLLIGCANNADKSSTAPAPAKAADSHAKTSAPTTNTPVAKQAPATTPAASSEPESELPSRASFKVQFGIMPGDYDDTAKGVLVGGVTPGTSAADAGIKTGDRLMTWNGKEITDIGVWMKYLAASKPGDVVEVGVSREGKTVPMKVKLKARQD
jgi:predicted metalloprotease with PDZ domain